MFCPCLQETYYVAPKTEGKKQKISKGKLPDRYRNHRHRLIVAGLIPKRRQSAAQETETLAQVTENPETQSELRPNKSISVTGLPLIFMVGAVWKEKWTKQFIEWFHSSPALTGYNSFTIVKVYNIAFCTFYFVRLLSYVNKPINLTLVDVILVCIWFCYYLPFSTKLNKKFCSTLKLRSFTVG